MTVSTDWQAPPIADLLLTCVEQENALLRKELEELRALSIEKDDLIANLRGLCTARCQRNDFVLSEFKANQGGVNLSLKAKPSHEDHSLTLRTIRSAKENTFM